MSAFCSTERIHIQRSIFPLLIALLVVIASLVTSGAEDLELRDLDVAGWDCLGRADGTAKTQDGMERNRMKNRSPENQTAGPIESLDTAAFLKKFGGYGAYAQGKRRSGLTAEQKDQLNALEKQIVSLTGWLNLVYPGPPETTNCGSANFHDWHLEIFENPSDHPPQVGDPTPIICELHPGRSRLYIEKVFAFNRSLDFSDYRTSASKRPETRRRRFARPAI